MNVRTPKVRRTMGALAGVALVCGSMGVIVSGALSSGASLKVHRDGFVCTKVTYAANRTLTARAGQVACALGRNDRAVAIGPGRVVLIAGKYHTTLIASQNRHSHDILLGGAGSDKFVGGAGWDALEGGAGNDTLVAGHGPQQFLSGGTGNNSFNCSGNGNEDVTVLQDSQGNQDDDCNNSDSATQEWSGQVTSTDGTTTMTISWSDANDAAMQWLQGNGNPTSVTFDITTATIERDGGGQIQNGDCVDVAANANGSTLTAVAVEAGKGGDDNQGDDNSQGDSNGGGPCGGGGHGSDDGNGDGSCGPSGASGPSGSSGPSGASGPSGDSGNDNCQGDE
jgi:hypothetical protein